MYVPGLRPLLDRRVPQILGIYLGSSYAVVEFLDLIVDRYVLSPHWLTLALSVFALFIPSVVLVAWNHGRPGRDEWTRSEKIALPANLVAAAVILWLSFSGSELGGVTTTVTVADEEGNVVEAEVAKDEFRRRLAIFYFANETGDADQAWLGYGIPEALDLDLDQEPFVTGGLIQAEFLQRRGIESAVGAPLVLYRELAEEAGMDYFLIGEVGGTPEAVSVATTLYETRSSRPVAERTHTGDEALELVDSISIQVRRDLEIPSGHIERARDASVAELLTERAEAFEAYARGRVARHVHSELDDAATHWEEATALDPTFALAHWELANVYLALARNEESPAVHQRAVEHAYRVPQRRQLVVKFFYYTRRGERDKALALTRMHVELFPDDTQGYDFLANELRFQGRLEEAVDVYKRGLEVDPSRTGFLEDIGSTYERDGRLDEALVWYREYAEALPDLAEPARRLARFFQGIGQLDSTRAYYQRASLLDPGDMESLLELAELDRNHGDFVAAEAGLDAAVRVARTPEQLTSVGWARAWYHAFRGEVREALRVRGEMHATPGLQPSVPLNDTLAAVAYQYAVLGETVRAFEILTDFAAAREPPWDRRAMRSYLETYAALRVEGALSAQSPPEPVRAAGFEEAWIAVDSVLANLGEGLLDCDAAFPLFRAVADDSPGQDGDVQGRAFMAGCQRAAGDLDTAEGNVRRALAIVPADPYSLLELARIQRDRGQADEARATLASALSVLENADPEYLLARAARLLQVELGG